MAGADRGPVGVRECLRRMGVWAREHRGPLALVWALRTAFFAPPPFKKRRGKYGVQCDREDMSATYRNADFKELDVGIPGVSAAEGRTLATLFEASAGKFAKRPCLGTRRLLEQTWVQDEGGVPREKLRLGGYTWMTYSTAFLKARNFGYGLSVWAATKPKEIVALYAETKAEWLLSMHGCFRHGLVCSTVYATLGEEALVYGLKQCETRVVVADHKLLKTLAKVLHQLEGRLTHVVTLGTPDGGSLGALEGAGVKVRSFNELVDDGVSMGHSKDERPIECLPNPEDLAVIMYTSGSTGLPKGVMISHFNAMSCMAGLSDACKVTKKDLYVGYLPLAHILELAAENVFLGVGSAIGYGGPQTLTNSGVKLASGTKGDLVVLRPTIMCCVPAVLDRIRGAVSDKVNKAGGLKKKLFWLAYGSKLRALSFGRDTPLWNRIVFKKVRAEVGGRIRAMLCGGAPLHPDSQRFMNIAFSIPILQGYGLTETCAGATIVARDDTQVGRAGVPIKSCRIKLMDWEEGGYRVDDEFDKEIGKPRGEVCVGGPLVSLGYYKLDEQTREAYHTDAKGERWFHTGDIGQMCPDGVLQIIDRKKDLVKLAAGEYVSLGKVDSAIVSARHVSQCCTYAQSGATYVVSLVVPKQESLMAWAENAGLLGTFADVCQRPEAVKEVLKAVREEAHKAKLHPFETPSRIALVPEEWLPEDDLITESRKLKRNNVVKKYRSLIDKLC